jgi:hypothetical protein
LWRDIQRNVFRLQQRIYQAERTVLMATALVLRSRVMRVKCGSGMSAGWATAPPTITGRPSILNLTLYYPLELAEPGAALLSKVPFEGEGLAERWS